jgi:hypothetical protein
MEDFEVCANCGTLADSEGVKYEYKNVMAAS